MLKPPVVTFHKGYRTVNLKDLILWVAAERGTPIRVDLAESLDFEAPWNLWLWLVLVTEHTIFAGNTPFYRDEESRLPLPALISYMGQPALPFDGYTWPLQLDGEDWVLAYLDLPPNLAFSDTISLHILHCRHVSATAVLSIRSGAVHVYHSHLDMLNCSSTKQVTLHESTVCHVRSSSSEPMLVEFNSHVGFIDTMQLLIDDVSAVDAWLPNYDRASTMETPAFGTRKGSLSRLKIIDSGENDVEAVPIRPRVLVERHPKVAEELLLEDPDGLSTELRALHFGVLRVKAANEPRVSSELESEPDDGPLWEDLR